MKAFLLAAGLGKRLRPLTDDRPKCLVPIAGKPLLHYWLSLCQRYGVRHLLVNVHHHADMVRQYLRGLNDADMDITVFPERRLLGSGGTVAANASFVRGQRDFFVLYADNLTNIDLDALLRFHRSHDGMATMGLFRTPVPEECGIVELDASGMVTSFHEKPAHPKSDLANAGVMVFDPEVFSHMPGEEVFDLGHDVLPGLAGRMHGYVIQEYLQDIGTIEKYLDALRNWRGIEESRAQGGPVNSDRGAAT
jgi:mannose-1-phosphate guanylyltransferase